MKKRVLEKKGISPMIATVLLIAMVIVIAMVIFIWFKSMSKEAITKFGDENIQLACEDVEIQAEYSTSSHILSVVNDGNVPIYGLKVKIYKEDGNSESSFDKSNDDSLSSGLNSGGSYTKDLTSYGVASATKIVIYAVLIGNSDSGTRTFTCSDYGIERSI